MDHQTIEPCEVLPACPVCGGAMELVYDRPDNKVCACTDCQTEIAVPSSAWQMAHKRRGAGPQP